MYRLLFYWSTAKLSTGCPRARTPPCLSVARRHLPPRIADLTREPLFYRAQRTAFETIFSKLFFVFVVLRCWCFCGRPAGVAALELFKPHSGRALDLEVARCIDSPEVGALNMNREIQSPLCLTAAIFEFLPPLEVSN